MRYRQSIANTYVWAQHDSPILLSVNLCTMLLSTWSTVSILHKAFEPGASRGLVSEIALGRDLFVSQGARIIGQQGRTPLLLGLSSDD